MGRMAQREGGCGEGDGREVGWERKLRLNKGDNNSKDLLKRKTGKEERRGGG